MQCVIDNKQINRHTVQITPTKERERVPMMKRRVIDTLNKNRPILDATNSNSSSSNSGRHEESDLSAFSQAWWDHVEDVVEIIVDESEQKDAMSNNKSHTTLRRKDDEVPRLSNRGKLSRTRESRRHYRYNQHPTPPPSPPPLVVAKTSA